MLRTMLLIFLLVIFGRILPHPANITPLTALCVISSVYLPLSAILPLVLFSCGVSDLLLAYLHDFPIAGIWSFYNYTGIVGLLYLGAIVSPYKSKLNIIAGILIGSLGFWAWSNFGVWLHSGMYAQTTVGITQCYTAAIPFLQQSITGDLFWASTLIVISEGYYITSRVPRHLRAVT